MFTETKATTIRGKLKEERMALEAKTISLQRELDRIKAQIDEINELLQDR